MFVCIQERERDATSADREEAAKILTELKNLRCEKGTSPIKSLLEEAMTYNRTLPLALCHLRACYWVQ